MRLPKYYETYIPILKVLNEFGPIHYKNLAAKVKEIYYSDLPEELLRQKVSTGENTLFTRIWWGKSYLKNAKYASYPKRGIVEITSKGKDALNRGELTRDELLTDPDYLLHKEKVVYQKSKKESKNLSITNDESPQDLIDAGIFAIEEQVKSELIEKLADINCYEFEKVVLRLLKAMGYGDFKETSKSNDGGIDGIINQDQLGLEIIYIQAKRYTDNKVREKEIRNFIGAMSGDTTKGVFVTTSTFDEKAISKAREAHHKIILIDGKELVNLMYKYNIGIQIKDTYKIKGIDEDFFESH